MGGAIGAFIAFGQTYGKEASGTLAPSTYWGTLRLQALFVKATDPIAQLSLPL